MDIIHQAYTHAHVHDYNNNNDSTLSMHNMPIHVRDEVIEFLNELKSIHKNIEEMLVKIETGVENTTMAIFDEFILMNEIWVDLKQKRNKIVHDVLACNQDQNSQDILKTWNDIHPQPQYPYLQFDNTNTYINVKHDQKFFDEYVDKTLSWDELKQKRVGIVHKLLSQNQDTQIIFQAWMDVFKRYLYLIETVKNTFVHLDKENSYKLKFIDHVHDV